MESQSEQFEREAEETRWQLAGTFEELRDRMIGDGLKTLGWAATVAMVACVVGMVVTAFV